MLRFPTSMLLRKASNSNVLRIFFYYACTMYMAANSHWLFFQKASFSNLNMCSAKVRCVTSLFWIKVNVKQFTFSFCSLYWSACRRSSSSCIRSSLIFFSNFLLIVPQSSHNKITTNFRLHEESWSNQDQKINAGSVYVSCIYIATNLDANDSIYNQTK